MPTQKSLSFHIDRRLRPALRQPGRTCRRQRPYRYQASAYQGGAHPIAQRVGIPAATPEHGLLPPGAGIARRLASEVQRRPAASLPAA
jgi:hypothetical protein